MSTRETEPRLKALFDKGIPVYSFSKLGTINECLYEAYLSYVKHMKGKNSCYGLAGGATHDCLEMIINDEATEADLLPTIHRTLEELELLNLEFPKDRQGGNTIRDGWVKNMTHFCNTFKKPKGDFETEQFFLYKTDKDIYLQGYIDLIKNIDKENKIIEIYDWKTSSMYSKSDMLEHGRQLILYALGKEQEGYTVNKIAWVMLKYAEIRFTGKKTVKSKEETPLSKVVERKNLIKDLEKYIIPKLEKLGKDELEIEMIIANAKENNEIPSEVADQFKILPYVMYYDLTDELRQECINYINETVEMWEQLDKKEINYPPRSFTKVQKNGKEVEDSFFCNQLCNFRETCSHIKEFNTLREVKQSNNDDEDLF